MGVTTALLFGVIACGGEEGRFGDLASAGEIWATPAALWSGSHKVMTDDGAWCWFQDPRAVYVEGLHRRLYSGWVTRAGDVRVLQYDFDSQQALEVTLHKRLHKDDHANPAILVRPDKRLVVFYSPHNGDTMRYRISTRPEDISSWGAAMLVPCMTTRSESTVSGPGAIEKARADTMAVPGAVMSGLTPVRVGLRVGPMLEYGAKMPKASLSSEVVLACSSCQRVRTT